MFVSIPLPQTDATPNRLARERNFPASELFLDKVQAMLRLGRSAGLGYATKKRLSRDEPYSRAELKEIEDVCASGGAFLFSIICVR